MGNTNDKNDKKVKKVDKMMQNQGVDPSKVDTRQKEDMARNLPDNAAQ